MKVTFLTVISALSVGMATGIFLQEETHVCKVEILPVHMQVSNLPKEGYSMEMTVDLMAERVK